MVEEIEQFKELCKDSFRVLIDKWDKLSEEQKLLGNKYCPQTGSFWRGFPDVCPNCKTELQKKGFFSNNGTRYHFKTCSACGYEYADVDKAGVNVVGR